MQIYPKEIINDTVEVHRFKHSVKSRIIYGIVLLSILGSVASLPFVFLDIYSSAQGILKSEKERNQITSIYPGKINFIDIKENQLIKKGDTLLIIDNSIGKEKINLLTHQLSEVELFVHDLKHLSNSKQVNKDTFQSFLYQKQYLQHLQKLHELHTRLNKSKKDFNRQQKLHKKGVIAKVEYENSKYNFDLTSSELKYYINQKNNQWQNELTRQNQKLEELKSTLLQNNEEQKNYIITANINGAIQNIKGFEVGNFVGSNTPIAEISPDSDLIAECYISPSDIGLLKTNNEVKIQIDAFNYNQWGMVTGKITSISKDVIQINSIPMFKVICSLDKKQLQLKNGFEGKLKKGMTLKAQFFIVNRSIYDLLYDTIDDWFKP